ncbi:MAG: glycosyltransferase [Nitrospira sp.]|nr:glycosyltransferase [Nitrospira sp.]
MRVLEIVASGEVGGGTNHVLQILRGFKDNMSLALITQRGSYLLRKAREIGIPCFALDFFAGRLDPRVPFGIQKILKSVQPQVVHVHGGRAAFFLALTGSTVPSVYTVHGFHFVYKPFPSRWLGREAERFALSRANQVIFVSQFDQHLAKTHGLLSANTTDCVIHNGIPCLSVSMDERGQEGLVGFVARLEPQKDPLLFLDSLEELPDHRAVIIGTGSLEMTVRKAIEHKRLEDRVTMLGGLSHEETLKAMRDLQVLVMTSRWEGLPLIPLEAMRTGVPVVAADVGGMREIIEDGRSGVLVVNRTATAIALAVKRVCQDKDLRVKLVNEARARVGEMFSEQTMLSRVREVYEKIAPAGPAV